MMSDEDYEILPDDINDIDCSFKIIVIGDSSVGKSCLTIRGTKGKFKDFYTPTIGFEFLALNIRIKEKKIRLKIWDTCGQEIYRSLISSFYRNASLAIIVYAINNKESFENLESWLDEIKNQTHPNLKIILIGNKSDLENERVIDKNKAENMANEYNFDLFMETSAKTGENARLIFIKAAQLLYDELLHLKENKEFNTTDNTSTCGVSISNIYESESDKEETEGKRRRKSCCK